MYGKCSIKTSVKGIGTLDPTGTLNKIVCLISHSLHGQNWDLEFS